MQEQKQEAKFVITTQGRNALINASNSGTNEVIFSYFGLGRQSYQPTPEQEALKDCFKVLPVNGVLKPEDTGQITVSAFDDDEDCSYSVYEIGVYVQIKSKTDPSFAVALTENQLPEDAILFAICSNPDGTPLVVKTNIAGSSFTFDLLLDHTQAGVVKPGGALPIVPPATNNFYGVVKLATKEEVAQGLDPSKAITPNSLLEVLRDPAFIKSALIKALQERCSNFKVKYSDELPNPEEMESNIFYVAPAKFASFNNNDSEIRKFKTVSADELDKEMKENVGYLVFDQK